MYSFLKGQELAQHQLTLSTLPAELLYTIFLFLPAFENLKLRKISKLFFSILETVAKEQLSITMPAMRGLTPKQAEIFLHTKQQSEIKYLTKNKSKILENNNDMRIIMIFKKLKFLKNNTSLVICHAKEKLLSSLNEIIIRKKVAEAQQSNSPTQLYLTQSGLTRFPDEIFNDDTLNIFWKGVYCIKISGNQLTTLPDAIGKCVSLRMLYVDNNKLITLPDTIGQCVALRRLDVNNNKLITLPDSIGKCVALRGLYVNSNEINTLPESIKECLLLEYLSITKNKLKELPANLPSSITFYDENFASIDRDRCLRLQKPTCVENEETQETKEPPRKRRRLR